MFGSVQSLRSEKIILVRWYPAIDLGPLIQGSLDVASMLGNRVPTVTLVLTEVLTVPLRSFHSIKDDFKIETAIDAENAETGKGYNQGIKR